MKDFLKTTQGKVIAGMGVVIVLLVATVIGLKLTHSNDTKEDGRLPEPSEQQEKENAKSPYNLYSGTWYGDNDTRSEITLEKDGTYTGSGWVNSGKYEFIENDSAIEFKDTLDGTKKLELKTVDGETVLHNSKGKYNFYHSKEQADSAKENKRDNAIANEELFQQKWKDILERAKWESEDKKTSIQFSDTNYEITTNGKSEKKDYVNDGIQILDETHVQYGVSASSMVTYLSIREVDGKYILKAPFISKNKEYSTDVKNVELTQQGTTKSEGEKEKVTVTESTDNKGNKVIKKEKVIEEKDGWE